MKTEVLNPPPPADPAAALVERVLSMPLETVVLSQSRQAKVTVWTDGILRTGSDGWMTFGRHQMLKPYSDSRWVENWVRARLSEGATLVFVDPSPDA